MGFSPFFRKQAGYPHLNVWIGWVDGKSIVRIVILELSVRVCQPKNIPAQGSVKVWLSLRVRFSFGHGAPVPGEHRGLQLIPSPGKRPNPYPVKLQQHPGQKNQEN
jgi:hypothetical protein